MLVRNEKSNVGSGGLVAKVILGTFQVLTLAPQTTAKSDFYAWRRSYEDIGLCQAHPGTFIMGHEAFKTGFISNPKHLLSHGSM